MSYVTCRICPVDSSVLLLYVLKSFLKKAYGKKERREIKEKQISEVIIENCLIFVFEVFEKGKIIVMKHH